MSLKVKIFLLIVLLIFSFSTMLFAESNTVVYLIPIEGTVDPGMLNLVERGIEEGEEVGADLIVFKIDTYGGLVDSGIKIKDQIFGTEIPTITYVSNRAWSAGALIALAGEDLVMASGSSIGAAETRPKEEKYISALTREFRATAERRERDTDLAAAMVDSDIEIEGVIEEGKILTLTAQEAVSKEVANLRVDSFDQLLREFDLEGSQVIEIEPTAPERFARLVTTAGVSILLLTLGFLGLLFEAIAPGWGVGGTIGLLSLAAFFSGYIINGVAGWGLLILFIAGIFLIALEVFVVPGFGVTGVGGILAIISSLYFLFPTPDIAISIIATTMVLSILGAVLIFKYFGRSNLWKRMILDKMENPDDGYIAPKDYRDLINKEGLALSTLRPAGIGEIEGQRLDVVSEGGYIEKGKKIKVVQVDGRRIVVKLIEEESD
ncbi:NfeD family protein [Halonatronum saccharophilum]|uniref:NfeD family protein n=1 Tax=Halonatronum saccharophilum TaxID=150060 RepID=UPI0004880DF5|nr:NfeD family protein [Halonatronum saccharophilum]